MGMPGGDLSAEEELYLQMAREIVDVFRDFAGDTIALHAARRAPLAIGPEGDIREYYGKGDEAIRLLVQQYEDMVGGEMAHLKARQAVRRIEGMDDAHIPDYLNEEGDDEKGTFLAQWISRFQAAIRSA
jgi:hypothetical protein